MIIFKSITLTALLSCPLAYAAELPVLSLGDEAEKIRLRPSPSWEKRETVKGATSSDCLSLVFKLAEQPPNGTLLALDASIVLFATYEELTFEESRDSILKNIKANQRLGNPWKVLSTKQVGPRAWWITTDQSGMVLGARPGAAPAITHLDHDIVYFTLGTKMTIQISEFFPANQPERHKIFEKQIIELLSTFTHDDKPMFVFEQPKAGKKKQP